MEVELNRWPLSWFTRNDVMSDYLEFMGSKVRTFGHETSWPYGLLGLSLWLLSSLKFNLMEESACFLHQSDSDKHLALV